MAANNKNWVEKLPYLHGRIQFTDLTELPRSLEDFEEYFNRIDNTIPTTELKALLKRVYVYQRGEVVFIDKIRNDLSKKRILRVNKFDALWKKFDEDLKKSEKKLKNDTKKDFIEIPEELKEDVIKFLESENKFETIKKILDFHIVGETKNKVLLTLLLSGSYCGLYQIILNIGESSGGKSHLAECVIDLYPKGHTYSFTGASDKALIYKDWNEERIIHISEVHRNPEILENLKDMGDQGIIYCTVEKNSENHFETVEKNIGKKSFVLTTTIDGLNPQLENRAWKLEPDHSIKQTDAIINYSITREENAIETLKLQEEQKRKEEIFKMAILKLKSEPGFDFIEINFLREIREILISSFLKVRRDHKKFFQLIKIIAFWNLNIREHYEINGKKILLAHPNDLINAFEIGEEIFMNLMRNITPEKLKVLNCFEGISLKQKPGLFKTEKTKKDFVSTNEIYELICQEENYKKSKKTFLNILNSLSEAGYLEKEKKGRENIYKLREGNTLKLLDIEKRKEIYLESFLIYNQRKEILLSREDIIFHKKKITPIELENLELYPKELYHKIIDVFQDNKTEKLNLDNLVQVLSLEHPEIENYIYDMIKIGLFKKNFNNELIYQ